ncbi:MAG: Gamma-glutamyl phosphate reductase [Alphaproteobacteria bacterium MarineAlpha5_Bin11]|nr:glutamate-5-semialdehyde dehydrogenase [Pelagibacteraceae bacterium]PPR45006.1 MAG: Gamma-glutamyl phosphate reductase [Alphaproteobacteria bacterium MarineAlpha5_Bin11]PPR51412.1 MAG: Gamma-glutamyl phosphate reductase [Alphaproteobacteria bacterium MarineAlpha5_Bin10]|tara:strand:- start:2137 stop:3390 length:1254 start_codon:yes stop_codon:yes gene_type:complete
MKLQEQIYLIGKQAKEASKKLAVADSKVKIDSLKEAAKEINSNYKSIINANDLDIENAMNKNMSSAFIERLKLNKDRIDGMAESLRDIADLPEPVGKVLSEWERPNGLKIQKISVPIGVIGIIYESRPNVTADASALGIKSGNAIILRGGSDSFNSSSKIFEIINKSFTHKGLPNHSVQMIPVSEREGVDIMLGLKDFINIIIPRGGISLIKKISEISKIPVIKHLDGICHVYIDGDANIKIAKDVILNSKMRRPGICGAAETLLIDKRLSNNLPELLDELKESKCEIRGDDEICALDESFIKATEEDWDTEYLDKIISVKTVSGVDEAIDHITKHSSNHTESIVTENESVCKKFFNNIDSAILLQNASTQFADGGEFGFGAEIGISTDKLHVRGPVGAEHLTSFKYIVRGSGQVRP